MLSYNLKGKQLNLSSKSSNLIGKSSNPIGNKLSLRFLNYLPHKQKD